MKTSRPSAAKTWMQGFWTDRIHSPAVMVALGAAFLGLQVPDSRATMPVDGEAKTPWVSSSSTQGKRMNPDGAAGLAGAGQRAPWRQPAGLELLPNGDTLINNWFNEWSGDVNPATAGVQVIEVTPGKKVVWPLRSWSEPANLGPPTTIQILPKL